MSTMTLVLIGLSILVGALVPIQAGINATLGQHGGHPMFGMVVNMTLALIIVYAAALWLRVSLPFSAVLASAPWYAWLGGLCGTTVVFAAMTIAPRIGAAPYVAATLVGTVLASLVVDHYGLLAFRPQSVTIQRIIGAVLVVTGMILVTRR